MKDEHATPLLYQSVTAAFQYEGAFEVVGGVVDRDASWLDFHTLQV
jgi:hypothetical protein